MKKKTRLVVYRGTIGGPKTHERSAVRGAQKLHPGPNAARPGQGRTDRTFFPDGGGGQRRETSGPGQMRSDPAYSCKPSRKVPESRPQKRGNSPAAALRGVGPPQRKMTAGFLKDSS